MLNAILGLFTSFNPIIVGLLLSAGAYIALRHRVLPPLRAGFERAWCLLRPVPALLT